MPSAKNPLSKLDHRELLWLAGILKDACRERLEKNQVSQAFEDRLYQRGPVEGRLDPRPFLKIWEPRYRKFLAVASELQALLEAEDARSTAQSLRAQDQSLRTQTESLRDRLAPKAAIGRHGPALVMLEQNAMIEGSGMLEESGMIEEHAANPRRKSRSR